MYGSMKNTYRILTNKTPIGPKILCESTEPEAHSQELGWQVM